MLDSFSNPTPFHFVLYALVIAVTVYGGAGLLRNIRTNRRNRRNAQAAQARLNEETARRDRADLEARARRADAPHRLNRGETGFGSSTRTSSAHSQARVRPSELSAPSSSAGIDPMHVGLGYMLATHSNQDAGVSRRRESTSSSNDSSSPIYSSGGWGGSDSGGSCDSGGGGGDCGGGGGGGGD